MNQHKINIRETEVTDLPFVMELWNCKETMKYLGFPNGLNTNLSEMRTWFEKMSANKRCRHFSIFHEEYGYCGETYYRIEENRKASMDIKLLPHVFGKGIAHYALSYSLLEALTQKDVEMAYVSPNKENKRALRLYEKLGFITYKTSHEEHVNYMEVSLPSLKLDKRLIEDMLAIKIIHEDDFERLWELSAKEDHYRWCDTNAPYFEEYEKMSYEQFIREDTFHKSERVRGVYLHTTLHKNLD